MTDVIIAPRIEDVLSAAERIVGAGWFRLRPSKSYVAGGQWVQASWSDPVPFDGTEKVAKLDPLPDVPYELWAEWPDGFGGTATIREYRTVLDSGTPVRWETLTLSGGPGSTVPVPSNVESRLAALEAALGSVSGGATNLAGITDMSAFMREVNKRSSGDLVRQDIGAGTSSVAIGTTAGTAADAGAVATSLSGVGTRITGVDTRINGVDTTLAGKAPLASPVFTGDPRVPTPASADNDTTIVNSEWVKARLAEAVASPATGPVLVDTVSGAYPGRPATSRRVIFCDPAVKPTNDGLVTGGGGAAPGDMWLGAVQ